MKKTLLPLALVALAFTGFSTVAPEAIDTEPHAQPAILDPCWYVCADYTYNTKLFGACLYGCYNAP